jgi:DNA-binding SARP family transcriptional activator
VEFRILGPFGAVAAGETLALGSAQQQAVLALLVVAAPEPVSRDRLVDELWGERPPASAAHAVHVYVSAIRKVLRAAGTANAVQAVPSGYALSVAAEEIDARRFEALVGEARRLYTDDPDRARELLEESLALWRGPALAGLVQFEFARREADRLDELRSLAVEALLDARLECGDHAQVIGPLGDLVAENPLRERPRELLMIALYRCGRHAEALAAYRAACEALDEIGLQPGPELRQLEQAILRHDESLYGGKQQTPRAPRAALSPGNRVIASVEHAGGDPARALNGHSVVVGLGSIGSRLALTLSDAGYHVVAIELDAENDRAVACAEHDIPIVIGDGADSKALREAGIAHARHLIVTCGDDARSVNVATAAEAELDGDHPIVLTAFVHLTDPVLLRRLSSEALSGSGNRDFRLEFFNAHMTGTRILLERHSPFMANDGSLMPAPRICVVGSDAVATNLVLLMAAEWRLVEGGHDRLSIVLLGPTAPELVDELVRRHPQIADICLLEATAADIRSATFQSGDVLLDPDGRCTFTKAFVAVESESDALASAIGLHGQPATQAVPIVVAVDDDAGAISNVLRAQGRAFTQNIESFGVLSSALKPSLMLYGINELVARASHQTYLREQRAAGVTSGTSIVAWEDLPESLKNSNRRFADGLGAALDAVGCALVPALLMEPDRSVAGFTEDEIETLARREHGRWMADLIRDGWRFSTAAKDPDKKLHPLLTPWEELTEAERNKDRDAVRAVPDMLARAGFEIIRRDPARSARESSVTA